MNAVQIRALARRAVVAACVLAGAVPAVASAAASTPTTPGVIPPQASPHGRSYAEWSAAWWQFDLSYPVHDPADPSRVIDPQFVGVDPAAVDCAFHQPDAHVWFLQGASNSGVAHRSCTVPTGTMLFFPIVDSWVDNSNFDGLPPTTLTTAELRAIVSQQIDGITSLSATIDGRPVKGLPGAYRVASPVFSYTVGPDNFINDIFGEPNGFHFSAQTVTGAVADGVYLMLAPLSPGVHVLHWEGHGAFDQDITYTLTVRPRGHA